MTTISTTNGQVILVGGAVGTEAACCCGGSGGPFCCCLNGQQLINQDTQEGCEALGGTWSAPDAQLCSFQCCIDTGGGPGLKNCYTEETCVAAGGEWLPPEAANYQLSCLCTHYAPADENGDCPPGFTGPEWPGTSGLPFAPDGLPCFKVIGNYIDCNNCNPNVEGWGYDFINLNCSQWNDVEFLDGNPLP